MTASTGSTGGKFEVLRALNQTNLAVYFKALLTALQ
jgi:hypothetical protein